MVTNAQLDNEKTSLQYQVDTLREVLLELEEELAESRRQYEEKHKVSDETSFHSLAALLLPAGPVSEDNIYKRILSGKLYNCIP